MSGKPKRPARLSLTRSQILEGAGAELLTLCQGITEDGSVSKEEIIELRHWLTANRSSELPSVAFLAETVERIIADRKVTPLERSELQKALETILPPEIRSVAVGRRREVEAEEKKRQKTERDAQNERQREEAKKKEPVAWADFMVAGVHYEGRPTIIEAYVDWGDRVFLARDPHNAYSRRAIEVRTEEGYQIGYVPEQDARRLAPLLDSGHSHLAEVKKILTGGRSPIPVVLADLFLPDANVEGAVLPNNVPPKKPSGWVPPQSENRRRGCGAVVLTLVTVASAALTCTLIVLNGV